MKRKDAILPGMIGMGILLLTGCYGDLTGKREEEAPVTDSGKAVSGVAEPETDPFVLSEEKRKEVIEDAGQTEPGQREDAEQEEKSELN